MMKISRSRKERRTPEYVKETSFWYKGCRIQKTYDLYEDNGIEDVLNDDRNYFIGTWFKVVSGEDTKRYKHTHFRINQPGMTPEIEGFLVYPIKQAGDIIGYDYRKLANPFTYFDRLTVETLYNNSVLEHEAPYMSGYVLLTDESKMIEKQYCNIFKYYQQYEDDYKKYNEYIKSSNELLDLCLENENIEDGMFDKLLSCENNIVKYRNKWMEDLNSRNTAIEKTIELIRRFKKDELLSKMHLI